MDIQYITVLIPEWRMGVKTERTVTYVRRVESMERFHKIHAKRNAAIERLSKPQPK